jgi:hypothetical protein
MDPFDLCIATTGYGIIHRLVDLQFAKSRPISVACDSDHVMFGD